MKLTSIAVFLGLLSLSSAVNAAVKVTIDINDPRAPQGVARSFSGNGLTLGGLKAKVGALKPGQVAAMWCEGAGMGADGTSAFDVIVDGKVSADVQRLKVGDNTRLEAICEADAKAFKARR